MGSPGRRGEGVSIQSIFVLEGDGRLWLVQPPFGTTPPNRVLVDQTVLRFQVIDSQNVLILGTDLNLWLARPPFGTTPPARVLVDRNVWDFYAINSQLIYILGNDLQPPWGPDRRLWLTFGPYGTLVPPARELVYSGVDAFQLIDAQTVFVKAGLGDLFLVYAPFGTNPPTAVKVDTSLNRAIPEDAITNGPWSFSALDVNTVLVLGQDSKLWLEHAPFGYGVPKREQIDGSVLQFSPWDAQTVLVVGSDGKLWIEYGPFGTVPPPGRQLIEAGILHAEWVDRHNAIVVRKDGSLWLDYLPRGLPPAERTVIATDVAKYQVVT
jgi:hypothetical protein